MKGLVLVKLIIEWRTKIIMKYSILVKLTTKQNIIIINEMFDSWKLTIKEERTWQVFKKNSMKHPTQCYKKLKTNLTNKINLQNNFNEGGKE